MTVEVLVSIDETGKVVKADPQAQTGVHPMLQVSAATAARQWKFSPARQGDRPVPSQMLLRFNFTPLR
jgi:TonB family protein